MTDTLDPITDIKLDQPGQVLGPQEIAGVNEFEEVDDPYLSAHSDLAELLPKAEIPAEIEEEPEKVRTIGHIGKRALQSALITLQVLPTNGFVTLGAGLAAYAVTKNPFIGGAVSGVMTGALEGASGLATADILTESPDNKVIGSVNSLLNHKRIKPLLVAKDEDLLPLSEGLTALYAGTPAVMVAKEAVMSEETLEKRTYEDRRKYALRTAAILGAICTPQGYLYAAGVDSVFNDPKMLAPVAAAVGVAAYAKSRATERLKRTEEAERVKPRYDLSAEELNELEQELVGIVEAEHTEEGIYTVWIKPDNKFANVLRTHEAAYFPEVKELPPEIEEDTMFFAFVDTRPGVKRIVHATTISGLEQSTHPDPEKTGFTTIDDLIEMDNFTAQEFRDYYAEKGIDISSSVSIDTNFRVGDWTKGIGDISTADLSYVAIFKMLEARRPKVGDAGAFCSINQKSIDSFVDFGMDCELLMGRDDFVTSESSRGLRYIPAVVRVDDSTRAVFAGLTELTDDIKL